MKKGEFFMGKLRNVPKEELIKAISQSRSKSDICRYFGITPNGTQLKTVGDLIQECEIDDSHFYMGTTKKYKTIEKVCPICTNKFLTKTSDREKITCSHSCSNTYFRSKENNPNWKKGSYSYRKHCFAHNDKRCIICNEEK